MDFTWSPYVALFFALESSEGTAAVWALNAARLNHTDVHVLKSGATIDVQGWSTWEGNSYKEQFLPGNKPFVVVGEPKAMNRRLVAQSGTFAIPGILHEPLEEIVGRYKNAEETIVKFEIDVSSTRREAIRDLYNMNVTYATLFPDLDGLAKSMGFELEYHWAFDPVSLTPVAGFPNPKLGGLPYWNFRPRVT